jgi:hypothetical protein
MASKIENFQRSDSLKSSDKIWQWRFGWKIEPMTTLDLLYSIQIFVHKDALRKITEFSENQRNMKPDEIY